jgi:hypothetical protein
MYNELSLEKEQILVAFASFFHATVLTSCTHRNGRRFRRLARLQPRRPGSRLQVLPGLKSTTVVLRIWTYEQCHEQSYVVVWSHTMSIMSSYV